jgi:hypothetical protein
VAKVERRSRTGGVHRLHRPAEACHGCLLLLVYSLNSRDIHAISSISRLSYLSRWRIGQENFAAIVAAAASCRTTRSAPRKPVVRIDERGDLHHGSIAMDVAGRCAGVLRHDTRIWPERAIARCVRGSARARVRLQRADGYSRALWPSRSRANPDRPQTAIHCRHT